MRPMQLAFLLFYSLCSLTPYNTSFLTRSVQLIFSLLHWHFSQDRSSSSSHSFTGISHKIGPAHLLTPSLAPHFKTFQVYLISLTTYLSFRANLRVKNVKSETLWTYILFHFINNKLVPDGSIEWCLSTITRNTAGCQTSKLQHIVVGCVLFKHGNGTLGYIKCEEFLT